MQSILSSLFILLILGPESEYLDSSLDARTIMWGLVAAVELDTLEVVVEIEE